MRLLAGVVAGTGAGKYFEEQVKRVNEKSGVAAEPGSRKFLSKEKVMTEVTGQKPEVKEAGTGDQSLDKEISSLGPLEM